MGISRRLVLARVTGVAAIVSLPAFLWLGWWQLAISGALAVAAALIAPVPSTRGAPRRRQWIDALRRRMHPHSWRPGHH